jgi:hypothetical protein
MIETLARATRQVNTIKETQIQNKEVVLPLFSDDMFLYLKDSKECTRRLLGLINTFNKVARYNNKNK